MRFFRMAAIAVVAAASFLIPQTVASAATPSGLLPTLALPRNVAIGGTDASFPEALVTSMSSPAKNPSGANDWACKPSTAHPYPVVLVHGTWENAYDNWNGLSQILKYYGYCVFAVNYGNTSGIPFLNGTGDMVAAANEVATFVNKVLTTTKAAKVDLIGHSQGGAQIRYVTNLLGLASKVDQVIAISPSNHPTTLSGITTLGKQLKLFGVAMDVLNAVQMPAAAQQADQSPKPQAPFYQNLNGKGETVSGVSYTNILTKYDEVVTPYTLGAITAGAGAKVDNIVIQSVCPIDLSEHLSMSYSKNVAQIILNKLDPKDQRPVLCYAQAPLTGSTRLI